MGKGRSKAEADGRRIRRSASGRRAHGPTRFRGAEGPNDNQRETMKILVVGTGAVGAFYGGKLAQAGAEVSTVCRSDYEAVVSRGIRIESPLGDYRFRPRHVVRSAAEFARCDRADLVLVATKVLPEIDVAELIRPAVGRGTAICLLQNGVEIEPPAAQAFPDSLLISGLAFTCINRDGPGHVRHLDYGRLTIGRYPTGSHPLVEELAGLFRIAQVPVKVSARIVRDRWVKLIWNAPFNPMSVLGGGVTTKDIMDSPEGVRLARAVMEDVRRAAASRGIDISEEIIEKNLEATRKMTPYKTSMCLDYEAGRPLEVEAILGNAVRAAHGGRPPVPVRRLETLYALLTLVDRRIRGGGFGAGWHRGR